MMQTNYLRGRSLLYSMAAIAFTVAGFSTSMVSAQTESKARWYKGNTHTHTLKSDGDSTPEEVTKWYRDNGYNFLFITDHEMITPVDELNKAYGKNGEFVVFTGQEVTDRLNGKPYHVNGLGVTKVTMPNNGKTVVENLQLNIDGVQSSGGIAQINHPNFGWALNADQIAQVKHIKLMELFNGHFMVNNQGGGGSPSVENIWDSVLSKGSLIYGIASDDVHSVRHLGDRKFATPGHGWIMVKATELDLKSIINALSRGDFYASTGIELDELTVDERSISIKIKANKWSKYDIRFIGKNGRVLKESMGPVASYSARGDEGYVRVKATDSNGQTAWTQPIWFGRK